MSNELPDRLPRLWPRMPGRFLHCAILAGILVAQGNAQNTTDTSRVRDWEVSLQIEISSLGLDFFQGDLAQKVRYEPNNPPGFKLGLRYGGIGGSIGYSTGRMRDEFAVSTQSRDLQFFWHRPRVGVDLYYQSYEGYFIEGDASRAPQLFPSLQMSTQTANVYAKILGTADLTALSAPSTFRQTAAWLVYASAGASHRTVSSTSDLDALIPSASIGALAAIPLGTFYVAPGLGIGIGYPFDLSEPPADMERATKFNLRLMAGSVSSSGEWGLHAFQDSDLLDFASGTTFQFTSLRLRLFKSWKF